MNDNDAKRRVLAIMPARGGSKRIPRKNVVDFEGMPMLSYPLHAALRSSLFDRIHVSTDDDEVATIAAALGADTEPRRPASLADDHTPILPVVRWVLQQMHAQGEQYDDVFVLFPCSPFLQAEDLRKGYQAYMQHGGRRNLITVSRLPVPVEWTFRRKEDGTLQPLEPGGAFMRSQDLPPAYYETGTFTIFSANWLLTHPTLQDDTNYVSLELPAWKGIDIDEPEDLEFARLLFRATKSRGC